MNTEEKPMDSSITSFFDQPGVEMEIIPYGKGIPFGIARVTNSALGIGGVYGAWGQSYSNDTLPGFLEQRLGYPLPEDETIDLAPLGFNHRHHIQDLTDEDHLAVEVEVGSRLLQAACQACGWQPDEVEAVMIGMSGPVANDYTIRIARQAGISDQALLVSVHKACDSSMGALQLALNPGLPENLQCQRNIAEELAGKKILVGGIEGLSRFINRSHDTNALQLFGNGAGIIGVVPGQTMKFLVGKSHEVFDEKGVLAVRMYYPHSRDTEHGQSQIDIQVEEENHIRFAGLMHEPDDNESVVMAGPMGMVKLFVRNGVQVVSDVVHAYRYRLDELGESSKSITTAIVHHANFKINKLKAATLLKEGIDLPMPWLLSEFGNVSAASNMIAFLRTLPDLNPGDHILFDGFGAGTYYDVFAVEMGSAL